MIDRIGSPTAILQKAAAQPAEKSAAPSLAARFGAQLQETGELVAKAEAAAVSMSKGDVGSVETILALSRAELALRHTVSVRNRVLESYQEIMRLPI